MLGRSSWLVEDIVAHYYLVFDNVIFWLYIASLLTDVILGNIKAWKNHEIDSNVGLKGTIKHFGLFAFVILFLPTLTVFLSDASISTTIMFYIIYQYILSIIENLAALGFDNIIPEKLTDRFRRLSDSEGKKEKEKHEKENGK